MRLSYSKLNTYRQCPLRYRFTYVDRLPRRPRRLFRAARRIHHALMRWLTYSRTSQPRWEDVRAAYESAWGAVQDPTVTEERDFQEGLQILQEFHEANVDRPCRPVLLEHKFAVPLGPHVLVGALDRVDATDSGYEVIDYKLDRELRTQEMVDEDLQLALYHLALEEGQGITPEALSLYFLRHNIQRTTTRTPKQSAELMKWVIATGDEISRQREWRPCVGEQCVSCDFRAVCPAHTGEPLPPPTARPAESGQLALALLEPGAPERHSPRVHSTEQLTLPLS